MVHQPEDTRPQLCRNRLRDEGQAYPRSGCAVCRDGGMMGCPHERRPSPPTSGSGVKPPPQPSAEAMVRVALEMSSRVLAAVEAERDAALAALQQVTAERDEARAEIARLRAEGEAKDRALKEKAEGQVAYWRERQRTEKCLEDGVSEDGQTYTPIGDEAAWQAGYCNGRMSEADWWAKTFHYWPNEAARAATAREGDTPTTEDKGREDRA